VFPGGVLSQSVTSPKNDSLENAFQTAMTAEDRGDLDQAESMLRAMRASHPGVFAIDESLGMLYVTRSRIGEALPLLQAAARDAPASDAAHANLGAAYFRLHRNQEALIEFRAAARLNPENAATQQSLGRLWMEEHHPERAAEAFAAALKSDPRNTDLMLDHARALLDSGNATQAIAALSEMPQVDQSAIAQSLLGEANEKLGSYKDAAMHLSRAVELDPSEVNAWALGVEFLRHWTFDAAIREFEVASIKFPDSARMRLGLGAAYFGNGNYSKAVPVFADLLKADPENHINLELLGMACGALSTEPSPRCRELIAYAESHPENAKVSIDAATEIVEGKGLDDQTPLARKLLESAIQRDPRLAEAHYELALLKQNQGDWAGSVPDLERALRLKPEFAKAHYRLALAYWRTGRKSDAQAQMELQEKYRKQQQDDLDARLRQITTFLVDVHN
jgi:tetratricopeptide (TPR) repeat protein